MKKLMIGILSLFILASCNNEDEFIVESDGVLTEYYLSVGTHLSVSTSEGTVYSNPNGSIRVRNEYGEARLLKGSPFTLALSATYTVEGDYGQYEKGLKTTRLLGTNKYGDFEIEGNGGYRGLSIGLDLNERIVEVNRVEAILTATVDGKLYKKVISFSNSSIWDQLAGLYSLHNIGVEIIDQKVKEKKVNSRKKRIISTFVDITSDIILDVVPN